MRVRKLPGAGRCACVAGLLLAALCPRAMADPAGKVIFAIGNVIATNLQGDARPLEKGAGVEEGDKLATNDGRAQIQFKDGGFVALQPQTQFVVERYRYTAAGDAEDDVIMSLIKGGLRTISGLVGKRDHSAYSMKAAVATIGIRGTDYALELSDKLIGHVSHGAIEVCNRAGCVHVLTGQAFLVPSLAQPPVLGERHAFLPPAAPQKPSASADSGDTVDSGQGSQENQDSADAKPGTRHGKGDGDIELVTPSAAEAASAGQSARAVSSSVESAATVPPGQAKKSDAAISLPALSASVSTAVGVDSAAAPPPGQAKKLDAAVSLPVLPAPASTLTGPPGQLKKLDAGALDAIAPNPGQGVGPPGGIPPGQAKR